MNTAVISTKIDLKTKKEAQITAEELGMPLSVVIKAFLKEFVRTKSINFSIHQDEIPNTHTIKALNKAEKNLKQGKGSPVLRTGKEAVDWLEKHGI